MRTELDALKSVQRFIAQVLPEPWDIRLALEGGDPPRRPFTLVELNGPSDTTGGGRLFDRVLVLTVNFYLEQADTRAEANEAALNLREQVWQLVKWGPDLRRPTTDRIPLYAYEPRIETHRFKVSGAEGGSFTVSIGGHTTMGLSREINAAMLAAAVTDAIDAPAGAVVGIDRGTGLWDLEYHGVLAGASPGDPSIDGSMLTGTRAQATARTMLHAARAPWRAASDYMRVDSFTQTTVPDVADPTLVMVAADLRLTFGRGLGLPLGQRIVQRITSATGSSGSEA